MYNINEKQIYNIKTLTVEFSFFGITVKLFNKQKKIIDRYVDYVFYDCNLYIDKNTIKICGKKCNIYFTKKDNWILFKENDNLFIHDKDIRNLIEYDTMILKKFIIFGKELKYIKYLDYYNYVKSFNAKDETYIFTENKLKILNGD